MTDGIYHVFLDKKAEKFLRKMDKFDQILIRNWIRNNLEGTSNPRLHGKALTANRTGEWRYRIGDYRLLAEIIDEQIIIRIFKIGHRRDIY